MITEAQRQLRFDGNAAALRLAVLQIFDAALGALDHDLPVYGDWSVQGFGVLRLYIRQIGRLHVWDKALRYPGVSMIHNHSWDLRSTVVSGMLTNTRYAWNTWRMMSAALPYHRMRLATGYDAHPVSQTEDGFLYRCPDEPYGPGEVYQQHRDEVHETNAYDGTVTIMEREEHSDGEAWVYWPMGEEWGDAKPRRATPEEIRSTLERALPLLL